MCIDIQLDDHTSDQFIQTLTSNHTNTDRKETIHDLKNVAQYQNVEQPQKCPFIPHTTPTLGAVKFKDLFPFSYDKLTFLNPTCFYDKSLSYGNGIYNLIYWFECVLKFTACCHNNIA